MKTIQNMIIMLALSLSGLSQRAHAQADPPDRVARLSLVEGSVSFLPSGGDENDWVAAIPNRPLTTGDRLWADANSRGELQIGSTAIRMDSNTGISFLDLDDSTVQIRLSEGSLNLRLRLLDPGNTFEVDTPNLAFAIKRPGSYRIDARPDNSTTVATVYQGEGEAIGGGRSWQVISDQQAIFAGADTLGFDLRVANAQPLSDFDRWARTRDNQEERVAAGPRHVSPEMTGYEDLNAYGTWREVPEYGWCWAPARVAAAWAPYRFGHWVWIAPWGWSWVEDEPWGFAPFHYGRWAHYREAWLWVPGPVAVRPVYAPALVAWVGGKGFSFSVSIGAGGGIGWFPLGPREVFVPGYRVSERYVTNINVTNAVINRTTITNVYNNRNVQNIAYVNRKAPNAVTVVSRDTFVNARPVMRNIVNVPGRDLASAPVSRNLEVAPDRASVYGAGSHNAPHPPAQTMDRPVVASRTPPAPPNHFARPGNTAADRPPGRGAVQAPGQGTSARPGAQAGRPAQPSPSPNRGTNQVPNRGVSERPGAPADRPPQSSRPLVRSAPAVRPPTAKEQADVQAKQKAWEKEHQRGTKERNEKQAPRRQ